jgi:hypothetical protein
MKKILLGLSNNISLHKEKIKIWSESFKRHSDGDIFLLAANMNEEDIKACEELDIKYKEVTVENLGYINHKRLEHMIEFLKTTDAELILCTDVFDVVFQGDPFAKMDLNSFDFFASGEGVEVHQDPWNMDNINKLFPESMNKCITNEIICSGVVAGKRESILKVYERMFELCELSPNDHNIKDQAALIAMIANKEIPNIKIFNLDEGWAMHCAESGPTQFFVSWGFKNNLKYGIPILLESSICTAIGEPYDIVHQFNRVPEWHEIIRSKYEK